jgi:hypothetical protein
MAETITTRAGSRSQERPTRVRPLSTFTLPEQRAIIALVEAADRAIPTGSQVPMK